MVSRIATFASSTALFNDTLRLQNNYATAQNQSSSGLKSADSYQGIATDSQTVLGLQAQINTINAQANNIKTAQNLINITQTATSNIGDIITKIGSIFSSAIGLADNSTNTAANVLSQATTLRAELVNMMNTQVGGRYVFGGNVQDTPPVNITDPAYNTATPSNTVPDTNYYQGDTAVQSVRASSNLTVSFGITADNPAFEQALRAVNMAIANPGSQTVLSQAFTLTQSALSGMGDITGGLNAKNTILDNELSFQSATSASLAETVSGLRDADVAAATVESTQIETQLQASYGILSKVLSLRLSDYLK